MMSESSLVTLSPEDISGAVLTEQKCGNRLAEHVVANRQTDGLKYRNPHCACALRVKYCLVQCGIRHE